MAVGAVNVVRGSKSSDEELLKIYCHSERYNNHSLIVYDLRVVLFFKHHLLIFRFVSILRSKC